MRMSLAVMTAFIGLCATVAQAAEAIDPDRIVSAATGDWDKDGNPDLALLVAAPDESGEDHSVYISLYDAESGTMKLKTAAVNKVWGNLTVAGQGPFLRVLPNGSMQIVSHNDAIGRDRWERKLTIAYRNFDFVVAGYTYTSYDTLDLDNTSDCDFNVLTGKGKSNDKPIVAQGEIVLLKDWSNDRGRSVCGNE